MIERHPDVAALLHATLNAATPIEIVQSSFEAYIEQIGEQTFDGCYIDIHPAIDPRWLPRLNWLRNRCAAFVSGPVHIWGYHWMARELVRGLEQVYIPRLRCGLPCADPLYQDLLCSLPSGWRHWSGSDLRSWLKTYAFRIAWPPQAEIETSLSRNATAHPTVPAVLA